MDRHVVVVGVAACLAGAATLLAPAPSRADSTREKVERLYLQSLDDYDNLRLDKAKRSIDKALKLARKAGLRDSLVAQIHLQLGLVEYVESKDPEAAEEAFVRALEIDPEVRLDPMMATPSIEEAFANAQARTPGAARGLGGRVGGRAGGSAIRHEPVERAYAGVNVPIYVEVPPDMPVYRATLFYRTGPGGPYSEEELEPSGTRGFSGYIPAQAVVGDLVEYYVAVTDRRGDELGAVGDAVRPYAVALILGAAPGGAELPDLSLDDELGFGAPGGRMRNAGARDAGHIAFGPGSGIGYILGGPLREFKNTDVDPGLSDTAFHLYAEMGVYLSESFMLLATGRFQFLVSKDETRVVPMPTLRGRWWYDGTPPVRQYVGIGAGWCGFNPQGGCVENRVVLADQDYVDTAPKGPGAAGVEGGLAFGSGSVQLMFNLFAYALFPDATSFQLDPNLALVIAF